ncbi:MAG: DNA recombination protein RmuC, partial [Prevotellaceae bacterium]|nr:DNA recombination protein RmuC [Prevotellaceae bacterium]
MNILFLIAGVALGGAAAWFAAKQKYAGGSRGLAQEEVEQRYVLKTLYSELREELAACNTELQAKASSCAAVQEANRLLTERLEQSKQELEAVQRKLHVEFENLAGKIFDEKSQKFVAVNEEKISNILNPLKEKIRDFEKKVEDTYNHETREKASLRKELELMVLANRQMTEEAGRLTRALKGDSKVQGDWGEMQLELLLEKSGLVRNVHFRKQENFKTDEGANVRPDYIINLPENKHFV